jgi:hypothetical protein
VNYRADYERNKLNYTLPQDAPQLLKAKANAELFSEVRASWGELGVTFTNAQTSRASLPPRKESSRAFNTVGFRILAHLPGYMICEHAVLSPPPSSSQRLTGDFVRRDFFF